MRWSWIDSPAASSGLEVALRHLGVDVPGEDVTDPGLPRLVAERTGEDAAVDDAAHPWHLDELVVVHHVTGRRAHDGQHLPGLDGPSSGRGDVGVDVADRNRDADGQPGPTRRLHRETAGALAQRADAMVELRLGEPDEVGIQRLFEVR